jgi:hypothetical protein
MMPFGAPMPEEQTQWFMVEERCPGDDHVLPESYPLDELLCRFPRLVPLCTLPDQAFSGCTWTYRGPEGMVRVRISPDA